MSSNNNSSGSRFPPSTPPPIKRHTTRLPPSMIVVGLSGASTRTTGGGSGGGESTTLTKSRSHEEHLSNRIDRDLMLVIDSKDGHGQHYHHHYQSKGPGDATNTTSTVTTSNSFNSALLPDLNCPGSPFSGGQGPQQLPPNQKQARYPLITSTTTTTNYPLSQHTSPSPSFGHTARRRLATEPGNLAMHTSSSITGMSSPAMSPSPPPPLMSPSDQTDSCFSDDGNNMMVATAVSNHPMTSVPSSSSSAATTGVVSIAPRSPRSHASGMGHVIEHRFCRTVKLPFVPCDLCEKPMYIGLKCKHCKYRCHRDCEDKVPPSCGLPKEFVDVFRQAMLQQQQQQQQMQASSLVPSSPSAHHSGNNNNNSIVTNTGLDGSVYYPQTGSGSSDQSPCSVKSEYRGREPRTNHASSSVSSSGQHHHSHHHPHSHGSHHRSKFNGGDLRSPSISVTLPFSAPDSSSNTSSCTSSTPSSPALLGSSNVPTPSSATSKTSHAFHFPDVSVNMDQVVSSTYSAARNTMTPSPVSLVPRPSSGLNQFHIPDNRDVLETRRSNDSEKTMSVKSGQSTDSEKTLAGRIDSQDSQLSCDLGGGGTGSGTGGDESARSWPRQNSLTSNEWEIPFDELKVEDVVGTGRFGTVYRGQWHGLVAIKRFNLSSSSVDPITSRVSLTPEDKKYLEVFRQEVAVFRKTRHDNLVLFMGACMKPPHLAIVTSFCKGSTLYTLLHVDKSKFDSRSTPLTIIQQICQGMSYLHARGITHKDLKTKNIFYDRSNGKVVITDFSATKLVLGQGMSGGYSSTRRHDRLTIPRGWLCYLAPEIMQSLKPGDDQDNLPFSTASDVFAFGTVWYEILYRDWPWIVKESGSSVLLPPEVIIWQVGRGVKPALSNLQAVKDVKDLLMMCWSHDAKRRPDFSKLLDILTKLPKRKGLERSPSHPGHLLRSAESIF